MRTAPMCFSILRVPRYRVHSLVNTWWQGVDAFSPACRKVHTFRLLSSSIGGHERKNSGSWSSKPLTTEAEGRSKNSLSSAANVRHEFPDKVITTTSTDLTITRTDGNSCQQIHYTDVRQLIAENKDLASLATIIVFDLETTGFRRDDRIIEIALQDLHGGEKSTFSTLINPGIAVPNTYVHGISTKMVSRHGVPSSGLALSAGGKVETRDLEVTSRTSHHRIKLRLFIRSRQKPGGYVVLVAHNAKNYDVPVLVNEFRRYDHDIPSNWFFLDTLPLCRDIMKAAGFKSGSLQKVREYYEIQLKGSAHRAMSDVHVLSLVLQKVTFDLKLTIDGLVLKTFRVDELNSKSVMKKKDSS
ncbi:Exonuclease DPD1 chloroplastic/mitochondrial [Bienertia sinuspersici]